MLPSAQLAQRHLGKQILLDRLDSLVPFRAEAFCQFSK